MASILQVFLYLCVILLVKTVFKMKKLTFSIMIALMALTALNANARMPRQERGVLYTKLINLLATSGQWDEQNLTDIGLKTLFSETEEDEECGTFFFFIHGKNTKVNASEGWNVTLEATGSHAIAIQVTLMTDNETKLYFKEKADHDAFMAYVKKSKHYNNNGLPYIGLSLIEKDEFVNDWYVITFHGG